MLERLTPLFVRRPGTAEDWLARMGRPHVGARDQADFLAWLEADPDHLRLYEAAKADRAALEGLRGVFAADLARLRGREVRAGTPRRLVLAGGLVAAAVVGGVLVPLMQRTAPEARLYESAPGRITDVVLDDGSRVTLDSGASIRVAMADDVRRVTLERGAAYFEVVHDAAHPFQVGVADRRVIVTGTRFATTLTAGAAEVSLLEGRVVIGRRDAAKANALEDGLPLAPGERAVFRDGVPAIRSERIDVETATAWRKRRLVFHDAPLSDVVAAASRYSDRPLVIADPRLGRLRVTAVLPLEGEGTLIDRMDDLLPVVVEHAADGRVLIRPE